MVPTLPTLLCRRPACVLPSLMVGLLLSVPAQAQSPAATRPDPLDPKAQVPALRYASPFAQFRRLGDSQPLDWREANDAVARIGGWRVYTREAQQPDPPATETSAVPAPGPARTPLNAPAPAPAPAAQPMPPGQPGHKH